MKKILFSLFVSCTFTIQTMQSQSVIDVQEATLQAYCDCLKSSIKGLSDNTRNVLSDASFLSAQDMDAAIHVHRYNQEWEDIVKEILKLVEKTNTSCGDKYIMSILEKQFGKDLIKRANAEKLSFETLFLWKTRNRNCEHAAGFIRFVMDFADYLNESDYGN